MKDGKILQLISHICLFCGEEMQQKWDEYTPYFECDCPDAVKKRLINKFMNSKVKCQNISLKSGKNKFYIKKKIGEKIFICGRKKK